MAFTRKDYRKQMADMFIENLKKISADDWVRPWKANNVSNPFNGTSKRYYNGSNQFFLMLLSYVRDYKDPRWYTFNQIRQGNYHLQKGSEGVPVEYWFPVLYDDNGKMKKQLSWVEFNNLPKDQRELCQIRFKTSYVYNGSCIEGLPALDVNNNEDIRLSDLVDKISYEMHVPIIEDGGNSAYYSPSSDSIHLPEKQTFADEISFNSTALHELSHATGHHSRLNRLTNSMFGSEDYAFEELIAEISSTFMAPYIGVKINDDLHNRNHIAYVKSWIEAIQNDPEVLFKAIAKAEVAANYLEWKGGIINEREFVKGLKNAQIAIGTDEKTVLIENMFPRESLNLIGDKEGSRKQVEKMIANIEEMASYFDDLQFDTAVATTSFDSAQLKLQAYKTELYDTETIGLAAYLNGELLYSNALDEKSDLVDRNSLIERCADLFNASFAEVFYGFEESSGSIKDSQIKAIEENNQKLESEIPDITDADTSDNKDLFKDNDKILETRIDELSDIEKFIEDHEKLLAEQNLKQESIPLVINIFAEDRITTLSASSALIKALNEKGINPTLTESYVEPRDQNQGLNRLYDDLKYHVERTDRVYNASPYIINEAPLMLNELSNQDAGDEYFQNVRKLVNQYRNFNVYIGEKDSAVYQKIKERFDEHKMFIGVNNLDSIDKLAENVIENKERLDRNLLKERNRTLDDHKKTRDNEWLILNDSIDIKEYARDVLGFNVVRESKELFTLKEHGSVKIYPDNTYFRFSDRTGFTAIDFIINFDERAEYDKYKAFNLAKEYYNKHHPERMRVFDPEKVKSRQETIFEDRQQQLDYLRNHANYSLMNPTLPMAAKDNHDIENYLHDQRGISKETISAWETRDLLYQDKEKQIVFVGRDFDNKVKYYCQKAIDKDHYFRDSPSEISSKSTGIIFENKDPRFLYVTEAAIDAMSLVDILGGPDKTMDSSFLSLQSASNLNVLRRYLSTRDTTKLEAIFLCQDSDAAGVKSVEDCKKVIEEYQQKHRILNTIAVSRLAPKTGYNDFNNELVGLRRMQEQQGQTRSPTIEMNKTPSLSLSI